MGVMGFEAWSAETLAEAIDKWQAGLGVDVKAIHYQMASTNRDPGGHWTGSGSVMTIKHSAIVEYAPKV